MEKVLHRKSRLNTNNLRKARKKLKDAVNDAKNEWLRNQCNNINNFGTRQAWNSINQLKGAFIKVKPSTTKQMKRLNGTLCETTINWE